MKINPNIRFYQSPTIQIGSNQYTQSLNLNQNPFYQNTNKIVHSGNIRILQLNPYERTQNYPNTLTNNQLQINKVSNKGCQLQKQSSANDFFNQLQNDIGCIRISKQQHSNTYSNQPNQTYDHSKSISNPNKLQNTSLNRTVNNIQTFNVQQESDSEHQRQNQRTKCLKCKQMEVQCKNTITLMKEQIQISSKQYSDRFMKILIQQAKQINDLRKKFINNEKNIIRIEKQHKLNNQTGYKQLNNLDRTINGKLQRSPSKLSLTKSNRSISPYQACHRNQHMQNQNLNQTNHHSRQKLTMLSKQLSPAKVNNRKMSQTNNNPLNSTQYNNNNSILTSQKLINQKEQSLSIQSLGQKIKAIQSKINILSTQEQQTKRMNIKIQILQKGYLNIFSSKLSKFQLKLNDFISKHQGYVNNLYRQLQFLSSKINNKPEVNSSQNIITIGANRQQTNNLYTTYNPQNASYSLNSANNKSQPNFNINLNQVNSKIKTLQCEFRDLKQLMMNLQTKQFKYDNYNIHELAQSLQRLQREVYNLEKGKQQINIQINSTEKKLETVMQMSKNYQKNQHLKNKEQKSQSQNYHIVDSFLKNRSDLIQNNGLKQKSNHVINNNANLSHTTILPSNLHRANSYSTQNNPYPHRQIGIKNSSSTKYTKIIETHSNDSQKPHNKKYLNSDHQDSEQEYQSSKDNQNDMSIFVGEPFGYTQYLNDHSQIFNPHQKNTRSNLNQPHIEREYFSDDEEGKQKYQNHEEKFQNSSQEQQFDEEDLEEDQFFYPLDLSGKKLPIQPYTMNYKIAFDQSKYSVGNQPHNKNQLKSLPNSNIQRFMEVVKFRQSSSYYNNNQNLFPNKPIAIQIDETGYVKCAENGSYIYDRNMDGFEFNQCQLEWLKQKGVILL